MVVLVAEDDTALRTLATLILQEEQYCVLQAANSEDALRLVRTQPEIDIIVSDIQMGAGFDGFELRRRILQERPDLPVLLMSGFAENEAIAAGRHIPFLAKPFSITVLTERVRDLLQARQTAEAVY